MKTFVISLESETGHARRTRLFKQCAEAGLQDVERIHGIDGTTLVDPKNHTTSWCGYMCPPSVVGCALSHMKTWHRMLEDETLDAALILEDDAVLVPDFVDRMTQALANVPTDYHVLFLGTGLSLRHPPRQGISKLSYVTDMHAYILSRRGARYLTDHITKVRHHIDQHLNWIGASMYAVEHDLAVQDGEATSMNARSLGFPYTINSICNKIPCGRSHTLAYVLNCGSLRLGTYSHHIIITNMVVLFCLLGCMGVPWEYVAAVVIVDLAVSPELHLKSMATHLGAYVLGLQLGKSLRFQK